MNVKFLTVTTAVFLICTGAVWAQKNVNDVYKMNVLIAAAQVSPETTSMLCISPGTDSFEVVNFDITNVSWKGINSNTLRNTGGKLARTPNEVRGVIILSGKHTLTGAWKKRVAGSIKFTDEKKSIELDFKPGGFYWVGLDENDQMVIIDITNNADFSPEKAQLEEIIQRNTTEAAVPADQ